MRPSLMRTPTVQVTPPFRSGYLKKKKTVETKTIRDRVVIQRTKNEKDQQKSNSLDILVSDKSPCTRTRHSFIRMQIARTLFAYPKLLLPILVMRFALRYARTCGAQSEFREHRNNIITIIVETYRVIRYFFLVLFFGTSPKTADFFFFPWRKSGRALQ